LPSPLFSKLQLLNIIVAHTHMLSCFADGPTTCMFLHLWFDVLLYLQVSLPSRRLQQCIHAELIIIGCHDSISSALPLPPSLSLSAMLRCPPLM